MNSFLGELMTGTYKAHTRTKGKLKGKDYLRFCAGPKRGRYVHQEIAEAMLGRPLREGEAVDHRDGNGLNPACWNLRVMTVLGNSRKRTAPLLGEIIFCGAAYWKERNPGWIDPLEVMPVRAADIPF